MTYSLAGSGGAVAGAMFSLRGLGNKKGPEEGPGASSEFGWHLAIPGDAPGYYGNKEFGNNVAHRTADTSQRLREHTDRRPKVKRLAAYRASIATVTGFPPFGEGENAALAEKAGEPA